MDDSRRAKELGDSSSYLILFFLFFLIAIFLWKM